MSGAGGGGQAALVAFMGARARRARGASSTGRGGCSGDGQARASTKRSESWRVTAVADVAFVLPPGLRRTYQPGRMLISDRQPTRSRACAWSVSPAACVSELVVAERRRPDRERCAKEHLRRRTGRSSNVRQLCGRLATRVFVCPRLRRRAR